MMLMVVFWWSWWEVFDDDDENCCFSWEAAFLEVTNCFASYSSRSQRLPTIHVPGYDDDGDDDDDSHDMWRWYVCPCHDDGDDDNHHNDHLWWQSSWWRWYMLSYPLLNPTETTVVRFSTRSNLWIVKTLRLSDAVAGTIREMVCQCQVGLSLLLTSHCSIYSLAIKTKKATKFQLWGKRRKGVSSWKPLNISSGGLWMVANPKCRRQT